MKIKEIIELTKTMPIKEIAKDLPMGEKKVREVLTSLGCKKPGIGERGWTPGQNVEDLEKDISEFVKAAKKTAKNSNANKTSHDASNDDIIKNNIKTNNKDDNMITEIQALIKGTSKENPARVYKGIYFDKDIAHFLDHVQHGNKSEIINKIVRQYLVDNNLM